MRCGTWWTGATRRGRGALVALLALVLGVGPLGALPAWGLTDEQIAIIRAVNDARLVGGPGGTCHDEPPGLGDRWRETFDLELVDVPEELVVRVEWTAHTGRLGEGTAEETDREAPYQARWTPFPEYGDAGRAELEAAIFVDLPGLGVKPVNWVFRCYQGGPDVPVTMDLSTSAGPLPEDAALGKDSSCDVTADWRLDYDAVGLAGGNRPWAERFVVTDNGVATLIPGAWRHQVEGQEPIGCFFTLGEHEIVATVTTSSGRTASSDPVTLRTVPAVEITGTKISTASGQTVTSSTWVLSGEPLRYSTTLSTEMTGGDILGWRVGRPDSPYDAPLSSGTRSAVFPRPSACTAGPTGGCASRALSTSFRVWHTGRTREVFETTAWAKSVTGLTERATPVTSSFRVYPRGKLARPTSRTIGAGGEHVLSTRLTTVTETAHKNGAPWEPVPRQKVVLQSRAVGASSWRDVRTLTTSSDGRVTTVARPNVDAQYRFVHLDAPGVVGPATSAVATVTVRG